MPAPGLVDHPWAAPGAELYPQWAGVCNVAVQRISTIGLTILDRGDLRSA